MEVSTYLKSFHKTQGAEFGTTFKPNMKANKFKEQRRTLRHKLISERRLINEKNMSPYKTPKVSNNKEDNLTKQQIQSRKRLEMLQKWKKEKMKKLEEEKQKTKPIFKVTHVPVQIGNINLENVNKVIKGKPFKTQSNIKKRELVSPSYNFAPRNYQFKGPVNVKPVDLTKSQNSHTKLALVKKNEQKNKKDKRVIINAENEFTTPKKIQKVYKKTPAKNNNIKKVSAKDANKENMEFKQVKQGTRAYELRNRYVPIHDVHKYAKEFSVGNKNTIGSVKLKQVKEKTTKAAKLETNKNSKTSQREKLEIANNVNYSTSELSVDYPIGEYIDSSQNDSVFPDTPKTKIEQTPDNKNKSVVYISPFVTISRGKESARKEFHLRKSKGGVYDTSPDMENSTNVKAGVLYFHRLLDQEISRIQSLCEQWNLYKDEQKPPEEACDMINVAIGQSQLLIQKKFKQFRELINSCENGNSEMPITCEDLHGYWDTAYIQVENLNKRYDNLTNMRSNNWEEIVPQRKAPVLKKSVVTKPKVQASSRLKEAIKAARNKSKATIIISKEDMTEDASCVTFDGGFFAVRSPHKSPKIKTPKPQTRRTSERKRKSLFVDVLTKESKKRESSTGLVILKASQLAKSVEKSGESLTTPAKSILKGKPAKSSTRRAKSVLFMEDIHNDNSIPIGKLISLTPEVPKPLSVTPEQDPPRVTRRRLTRNKLF